MLLVAKQAIIREFHFFIKLVWSVVAPNIKTRCGAFLANIIYSGETLEFYLPELVKCWRDSSPENLKSIMNGIAESIPKVNRKVFVESVCEAVSTVLPKGCHWEVISCLCINYSPPVELLEICMEECVELKKCRETTLEIFDALSKLPPASCNVINKDVIKRFEEYVTVAEKKSRPVEK